MEYKQGSYLDIDFRNLSKIVTKEFIFGIALIRNHSDKLTPDDHFSFQIYLHVLEEEESQGAIDKDQANN